MSVVNPPKLSEYSSQAIQKAVVTDGIKHPATLYPLALGIGCGFIGWLFGTPALYLAAIAGILAGPAWAISRIFFFHEKFGSLYIQKLNKKQKAYEEHIRKNIADRLRECMAIEGRREYAEQGIRQFQEIRGKMTDIREILEMKLSSGELTFGRFLGATEQVFLSVLDNLKSVAGILKSTGTIDTDYIHNRLKDIAHKDEQNHDDLEQENTLKQRLDLYDSQQKKVNALLSKNEKAITELENLSAAVAQWRTVGQLADMDYQHKAGQFKNRVSWIL